MKKTYRAYAMIEMLVIIVVLATLITLSVRPFRDMITELSRSTRTCQTVNLTAKAFDQVKSDIEQCDRIIGLENDILMLEESAGVVRYSFADGTIVRQPAEDGSVEEHVRELPNLRMEVKLWNHNTVPYAVELTTWDEQIALGKKRTQFKQSRVFFRKGKHE